MVAASWMLPIPRQLRVTRLHVACFVLAQLQRLLPCWTLEKETCFWSCAKRSCLLSVQTWEGKQLSSWVKVQGSNPPPFVRPPQRAQTNHRPLSNQPLTTTLRPARRRSRRCASRPWQKQCCSLPGKKQPSPRASNQTISVPSRMRVVAVAVRA